MLGGFLRTGWSVVVLGWFLAPVIILLVNKILLPGLGFDASRKLRDLEIHSIPEMKKVLMDIEEQRMQRKARKERSAVRTLDALARDVKSALYHAEDILDLVDYHQIERDVVGDVGDGESGSHGGAGGGWLQLHWWVSESEAAWARCRRSWLGRCVRWARSCWLWRLLEDALQRSAALLPISRAPGSASFLHRLWCWCIEPLLGWVEVASSYRNWSYDVLLRVTSNYQLPQPRRCSTAAPVVQEKLQGSPTKLHCSAGEAPLQRPGHPDLAIPTWTS